MSDETAWEIITAWYERAPFTKPMHRPDYQPLADSITQALAALTRERDQLRAALAGAGAREREKIADMVESQWKNAPSSAWESAWNDTCAWIVNRIRTAP